MILETIWVLSSVYKCSREDIILALENLLGLAVLIIEERETLTTLCRSDQSPSVDLADLLIGLTSRNAGCETILTFDQRAAKSTLFTLIR